MYQDFLRLKVHSGIYPELTERNVFTVAIFLFQWNISDIYDKVISTVFGATSGFIGHLSNYTATSMNVEYYVCVYINHSFLVNASHYIDIKTIYTCDLYYHPAIAVGI